ncbi:MAG: hypothetical protein Terrestrivirus1_244 [Terrestrivirus sp.]|uniref:Uncharacterized protein n=1 Tax=Terrestrivirus sp. TaxID=2487775 RepID=A0A3G4ZKL6_9VIRU|nr:MAG: hypothetical protein Terrestrivirus1_244 [Terrestrivirus sp.]
MLYYIIWYYDILWVKQFIFQTLKNKYCIFRKNLNGFYKYFIFRKNLNGFYKHVSIYLSINKP